MDKAAVFNKVLQPVLREALLSIFKEGGHLSLTPEVCQQLLQVPPAGVYEDSVEDEVLATPQWSNGLCVLGGYPQYPLYERLSLSLAYWMVNSVCPVYDLPVMYMLNESTSQSERQDKMRTVGDLLTGRQGLWDLWSEDERCYTLVGILKELDLRGVLDLLWWLKLRAIVETRRGNLELDLRGVLDLLGVRCTVGSVSLVPPSQQELLATFTSLHHPSALLSVGGRALTKHSHRDQSDNWWGVCSGSERDKNKHALKVALRILKEATWINIHSLPHDVKVIEVRTAEGYGVRWSHDGSEFRGFLEPQMTDGHTVGWRH